MLIEDISHNKKPTFFKIYPMHNSRLLSIYPLHKVINEKLQYKRKENSHRGRTLVIRQTSLAAFVVLISTNPIAIASATGWELAQREEHPLINLLCLIGLYQAF